MSKVEEKKQRHVAFGEASGLIYRLIREFAFEYKGRFATAVLFMLLVAGSTAAIAWLTRSMVNSIFVEGDGAAVWMVGMSIMAAFAVKGISGYVQTVLMGSIGVAIAARLQQAQFDKLLSLKFSHFAGRPASGIVAKVVNASRASRSVVVTVITNLVRDAFTLVALCAVMIYQDPLMSVIVVIAAPAIIIGLYYIIRGVRRATSSEGEVIAGVNVAGVEALQGLRVVKSFNMEPAMADRIGDAIDKMEQRQNAINRVSAVTSPLFDVIGGLIIGSFVFYAGWQTLANDRTPGEFMAFITAFLLAFEPARRLGTMNVEIQRQIVHVKSMFDLLDNADDVEQSLATRASADIEKVQSGGIEFRAVSFRYRKKAVPAIVDVSFTAMPGEIVALVGRSGAGKSTIVNLILGLYRANSGDIVLGDKSIKDIAVQQLRANVSYVAQETFLFGGTIKENLLAGRAGASPEEMHEALKSAGALEFVQALPEGIDTDVGDNGSNLSGGQRQRIAIARALLKDAPLLVLDEATSALDGETERDVRTTLSKLRGEKTVIVIAHRLSTIQEADRVIVLDKGKVVGVGPHQQLKETSAVYRSLFFGGDIEEN